MMNFNVTEEQERRAADWINSVARPHAVKVQRASTRNPSRDIVEGYWNDGVPYGESIVWSFSNSSGIGQTVHVSLKAGSVHLHYDLTDYDTW